MKRSSDVGAAAAFALMASLLLMLAFVALIIIGSSVPDRLGEWLSGLLRKVFGVDIAPRSAVIPFLFVPFIVAGLAVLVSEVRLGTGSSRPQKPEKDADVKKDYRYRSLGQ